MGGELSGAGGLNASPMEPPKETRLVSLNSPVERGVVFPRS